MNSFKDELLEIASFMPYPFKMNSAWHGHLPFAAWLTKNFKPAIIVELGSHWGHSYFTFCQAVKESSLTTQCYAVDTWQGDEHAGNYGDEVYAHANAHNKANYANFSNLLRMTFDEALNHIADSSVDLLHIDGLHTYEAVKHDFDTWLPKLAPGAVVLFHDTNVREREFGVWKLWEELKRRYPNNLEFLHSHGLGVLQLDGAAVANRLTWLDPNSVERQKLKDYFSELGARQIERFELNQMKTQTTNLSQAMAELSTWAKSLQEGIFERDGRIDKHTLALAEISITTQSYQASLKEREEQILHLTQDMAEVSQLAQSRQVSIVGRDRQIANLFKAMSEFSTLAQSHQTSIVERDVQIAQLTNSMAEVSTWAHSLQAYILKHELAVGEQTKSRLNQDLQFARMQHEISSIRASKSWYITAPMRFILRQIRRIPVALSLALPAIKLGGGVSSTFRKAYRLYRREGIVGIKRGFQHVALSRLPAVAVKEQSPVIPNVESKINSNVIEKLDHKEIFRKKATFELDEFFNSGERLTFAIESTPKISIIIIVWNSVHLTYRCLKALLDEQRSNECPSFEVIIFNNASSDATSKLLELTDNLKIINNDQNIGFLLGCNQAAKIACGDSILLLNSDAFVRKGTLYSAYTALYSNVNVGVVGGRIVLPTGVLQEAGSIIWDDGSTVGYCREGAEYYPAAMHRRQVDYCSGAFLMTPHRVWKDLKGFDENYAPAYYEEVDFCMRVRQSGLIILYEPWAIIDHYEFGSENKQGDSHKLMLQNREKFVQTHNQWLTEKAFKNADSNLLKASNTAIAKCGRLLVFDDQVPFESLGAGFPRMRALLNTAASNGWQVVFFPLDKSDINWEQARREFNPEIEFVTNVSRNNIEQFLKARRDLIDVLLVSRPNNMQILNECFDRNPELLTSIKLIYDAEAVFSVRDMLLSKLNGEIKPLNFYTKAIDDEVSIGRHANAITCVSAIEASEFSKRLPVTVTVSVLSHSIAVAEHETSFDNRSGFLFVGRLLEADSPNRKGLSWFINCVWPHIRQALPEASLQVVGHITPIHHDICSDGVVIRGAVDDLSKIYDQARIFIAPIQFAAGIPIKIIEASAAGLPVVGTTLMTKQLGWTSGLEIQDSDDAVTMASKAINLYNDSDAWSVQSIAAKERVACEFSASKFSEDLSNILSSPTNLCAFQNSSADAEKHRTDRVNSVWGSIKHENLAQQYAAFPLSHPYIKSAMYCAATGNKLVHPLDALASTLPLLGVNVPVGKAASVCCGTGAIERHMHKAGVVKNCFGYDLSSDAIAQASRLAIENNLTGLKYIQRDLDLEGFDQNEFDFVIAYQAIHHIDKLERVMDNIHASLRAGGIFYLDEYVGPNRFQWSDVQLEEMTKWIKSLPEKYTMTMDGARKEYVGRATIQEMIDFDPSEAVRSEDIEHVLKERFEIIEIKNLGGTLSMMALAAIAQNFDPDNPEDCAHLDRLLEREKMLIAEGILTSDFKILIARKV